MLDWLGGGGQTRFSQWRRGHLAFTQSGRAAIALALRLWGISRHDEVLIPAYNCGSEISPIVATGATVKMYRVGADARIDIADLLARVTPRTRMILVTHYFGQPTDLVDVVKMCRVRDIKLLEDCALSLFSSSTGHLGDAAIFSLRKSLPASDGGVLLMNATERAPDDWLRRSQFATTARGALSLVKKWSRRGARSGAAPASASWYGRPDLDLPASYYWSPEAAVRKASRLAHGLMKRTDPNAVARRRRENYTNLRRCLGNTAGVEFLWQDSSIPEGVCPLGLPIVVADKQRWCDRLNAARISVSPWWVGCHQGLEWHAFPEALELKGRLILLPVHQGLAARHMEYIADVVGAVARGTKTCVRGNFVPAYAASRKS